MGVRMSYKLSAGVCMHLHHSFSYVPEFISNSNWHHPAGQHSEGEHKSPSLRLKVHLLLTPVWAGWPAHLELYE